MSGDAADVLVIGGGPAGACLGVLAAAAGARVVILERDRFPRDKVCGEFLSAEGVAVLDRLGLAGRIARDAPRIDRCLISDRRGRAVESELPDLAGVGRAALGISRATLDTALLEAARASGAEVRERCEATGPVLADGRVVGARVRRVGSSRGDEAVPARVVVAADGRRSAMQRALRPSLGDPTRSTPRSWFGLKVHLRGDVERLGRRVELHLFDGGYAGLGEVEGARINLGLLATVSALRSCGGSPDRLLHERILANPLAAERLAGARPCSPWRSVGPLRFGARAPEIDGLLLVGDAAGTIDPFSGEGMSNALVGAEIAVPWVLAAASRGGVDSAIAAGWTRAWRRAFGPVTRRVRLVGLLFERPRLGTVALAALACVGRSRLLPSLVAGTRTGPVTAPPVPDPEPTGRT